MTSTRNYWRDCANKRPPNPREKLPAVAAVYDRRKLRIHKERFSNPERKPFSCAPCSGVSMTAENDRSPRLQRLERYFIDCPIFYITACTADRRAILANERVRNAFISFADIARSRGVFIGRYVIMPDHIHLFVGLDDQKMPLSMWMKSLKNTISKTLRLQGVPVPHWQKGFFDHVLRSNESYEEKWYYVRENPLRAGLVTRCNDWPFAGEVHALEFRRS
jgi:putative transposase